MTDEWRTKVDKIIDNVSQEEEVRWSKARAIVHKYVCGGKCGWYQTQSGKAGFDRHDLSKRQKEQIQENVKQVMKGLTVEEAKWRIHQILCPGHPRPRPNLNTGRSS